MIRSTYQSSKCPNFLESFQVMESSPRLQASYSTCCTLEQRGRSPTVQTTVLMLKIGMVSLEVSHWNQRRQFLARMHITL